MNTVGDQTENLPAKSSETNKWLVEEYKLIQSKIDKLGEDRFKVRSWCVTLVSGLVVGAKFTTITLSPILLFAMLAVFLFHLVEHQQRETSRRLGWRAREIERALAKQDESELRKELEYVPGIANHLSQLSSSDRRVKFPWPWKIRTVRVRQDAQAKPRKSDRKHLSQWLIILWKWFVSRADNAFYAGQYFALAAALVYSALGGNLLKEAKPHAAEPPQYTNTFLFMFPTTNLLVTNYMVTNVLVTNYTITNVWLTNFTIVDGINTNKRSTTPTK